MKKLFSFVLALLLCQGLFALETTLWEDTYVNQVELNNTVVSTFNTGDVLRVYVTVPAGGGNFKICYKGPSNNWEETAIPSINNQWPWINGGDSYYEIIFTDADITAFEGMLIYLYENGNPITKVSLITPDPVVENRTVWTGSQILDWSTNPSQYLYLDAATVGVLNAGDTIVASYSAEASAQLHISMIDAEWGWQSAIGSAVEEGNGNLKLCLTAEMLANMVQGVAFSGINCTLTAVDIHVFVANPTIWTGNKDFGTSWGEWEQIAASAFANAEVGQLLRFKFSNLRAGAQLKVSKSDWNDMPDAEILNLSGRYCDFSVTTDMLTELQAGGAIISGLGFTLTEALLINPADLRPLTAWVPVTDNWVFAARPSITVHVDNPYSEAIAAQVEVEITTDKAAAVVALIDQLEIPAGGSHDFVFTTENDLTAGFYKATCIVNDDLARAFGFAINPTGLVSAPDKQTDFNTFWAAAKAQLDAIDINASLTEIPAKSTAARKVYLVEMQSVPDGLTGEPVIVRGYYCEPQDGQPHPVIMHYLGYDSGYRPGGQDVKPYCPSGDAESDYAEFYLSTRGQSINNRAADEREADGKGDFTNTYGDWFAFNFGDKDSYYYRGAYMDCVRAIQFMASRPTSDMNNLYAEGQSQGGAFTYAAAALSGYTFRAIAPAIAFMGDFPDYFDIVNWPAYVARENQGSMTDDEMFAFLSYFDTKNLATNIACPVIACIGLQDNVCPPHTNIAPYNNLLSTDKELIFNPENYHQAGNTWYSDFMQFFLDRRTTTFVAQDLTLEATDGTNYWATFSNTDAVTFFPTAEATIYTVNVVSDELQLAALTPEDATINSVVTNGCFVPANTGVLVQTAATSVPYYTVFNHAVDALMDNMLYPGNDEVITAPAASDYYLLAYGDNVPTLSTLGFYWGADEGAAFKARKGGTYLAVPEGQNAPSRLIINAPGHATDLLSVDTDDSAVKLLRNGWLLIRKNGVTYTATGAVVK